MATQQRQTRSFTEEPPKDQDEFARFFTDYYSGELSAFLNAYPDRSLFTVDYGDVFQFDSNIALDWLDAPDTVSEWFEWGLAAANTSAMSLSGVTVSLTGLNQDDVYSLAELRNEHAGQYIGVHGDMSRVTTPNDMATVLAFNCERCGVITEVEQKGDIMQEPYECRSCERKGPFLRNERESEFVNYSKLRIETPPEDAGMQGSESIDGYVTGDLVEQGHENGLIERAGERVTVYGVIERVPVQQGKKKKPIFERRFRVEAIDFETENETIQVEEHQDEFEQLAKREDAVELFKQSLAPELYATDAWQAALKLGVAYLFGAPRLDVDGGPTYRGDIHALLVTDYAMGKSTFNEGIESYSPKCINKSATGLGSDVGLLAAAVKDDFGDGQWTIKPGILVRGNGGHVILDEIDKPDADLAKMNDALEGSQIVDVEKAGESATYQSRVGLMATGNPENARYNQFEATAHQIGMDETLLSRFDGIVTMRDTPDEETDAKIAEQIIDGMVEASEYVNSEREDFDVLDRPVPLDVGRAWVKYARENVNPVASKDQLIDIRDWYAEEVRTLNESFAEEDSEGEDMPVPATARVVENTIRFASAFARLHLREKVNSADVERAKKLARKLVGQTFDDGFAPPESRAGSQDSLGAKKAVAEELKDSGRVSLEDLTDALPYDKDKIRHHLQDWKNKGEAYEPETNVYQWT